MTATPPTTPPVPHGDQDVDFDELARKIVAVARLRRPRVHRAVVVTLGVLTALCLLATATRLSPAPLIPVPGLGVAAYGAWRWHSAGDDRRRVAGMTVVAVAVAVSLWAMSFVARNLL
ncbi:hypothetical protein [Saccharomonospora piscinae]|uniref:hypothetical protein n=1 Tax=Saccharomonospora piscinae TaxID=687388 RepID=UPI0004677F94|nr:hypothetical protein [Saccharomonospora piscinae]